MNAYLIMCHKNESQVIRLIERLIDKDSDIFLHCDSNMSDNSFHYLDEFSKKHSDVVHMTQKRIHGILNDRSLVDISMELINNAKKEENNKHKHYKYYCLLSGQDYPIKTITFINSQLNKSYPNPFIDCTSWKKGNWVSRKFSKNKKLIKFRNWIDNNFENYKLSYKSLRLIAYVWKIIINILHLSDYHWFMKNGYKLYGGSQWWILPDICIDYIKNEYDNNTEFSKKLLQIYTPDETYFQNIAILSPIGMMIKLNETDGKKQDSMTFANFDGINRPFLGHPYIITKEEVNDLIETKYFFARKFDEKTNKDALDLVDELMKKKQY